MYGRDADLPEETAPAMPSVAPSSAAAPRLPITTRRLALLVGGLVALWFVGVFARQVGEAASAASQADQMRARNAAEARDVASLEQELQLIKQPAFVAQMARGYLLGSPREIPFTLDPNAAPLPSDAPGSAGIKPDEPVQTGSPLDSWLKALFGSQP
jgi:cell division protein FtsB